MKQKFSLGLLSLSEESKLFESLTRQKLDYEYSSSRDKVLIIECTSKLKEELEKQGCQAIEEEPAEQLDDMSQVVLEALESFTPSTTLIPDDFSGITEVKEKDLKVESTDSVHDKIAKLKSDMRLLSLKYQDEYSRQNQYPSFERSYREADRIKSQITDIESKIKELQAKVNLEESVKSKPAQEKIRDFLIQNPGATRRQILQDLFGISPEDIKKGYNYPKTHTIENTLQRTLQSGLIKVDNTVKPMKWYAVEESLKESKKRTIDEIIEETIQNDELIYNPKDTITEDQKRDNIQVFIVDEGQDIVDVEETFKPYTVYDIKQTNVKRPKYSGPAFVLTFSSEEEEYGSVMSQDLFNLLREAGYKGEVFEENIEQIDEGNQVSSKLPSSIDSFLQDIAQYTELIHYKDIMNIDPSKFNIKEVSRLIKKVKQEVAINDLSDEEIAELPEVKQIIALVKEATPQSIVEGVDQELQIAKEEAKQKSRDEGCAVHVNHRVEGNRDTYFLSDWYDSDSTVASYENGREL